MAKKHVVTYTGYGQRYDRPHVLQDFKAFCLALTRYGTLLAEQFRAVDIGSIAKNIQLALARAGCVVEDEKLPLALQGKGFSVNDNLIQEHFDRSLLTNQGVQHLR